MLQPKRDPFDPHPREGYLSWDDYFMALAFLSAERSKDPNKQVGACIVDQNHVIIGIGYNGFPRGCPDGVLPWSKKAHDGDMLGTKYPYVVHAEANALLNKNTASVEGASVYVTMFPCNECAKLLIQAGIREVVYHEAKIQTSCQQSSAGQLSATSVSLSIVAAADDASAAVSTKPHQQQAAADEGAGMVDEARVEPDPCYLASMRLLQLAGIRLRQHRLQRSIVLGCS